MKNSIIFVQQFDKKMTTKTNKEDIEKTLDFFIETAQNISLNIPDYCSTIESNSDIEKDYPVYFFFERKIDNDALNTLESLFDIECSANEVARGEFFYKTLFSMEKVARQDPLYLSDVVTIISYLQDLSLSFNINN